MTAAQLGAREGFVELLQGAGWEVEGWEHLFENGASLTPEAQAEHRGDRADLRLGYLVGDGYAQLEIIDHEEGVLRLRLYPLESMESVVGHVIGWESALRADTLPGFVKDVAPVCRGVFLESGDEFVSLSTEEDAGES